MQALMGGMRQENECKMVIAVRTDSKLEKNMPIGLSAKLVCEAVIQGY